MYTGNQADEETAKFFWDRVVNHYSFVTGGHGKNEYFGEPDKLSDMVDGRTAETCNVYNMLKMTRDLFSVNPDIRYADFHERALFNDILPSQDPRDGTTSYMLPVGRGVQHEYQRMFEDFTCCVGTSMESHALHGAGIYYYKSSEEFWIGLYAPSIAHWDSAGVEVEMATDFPIGSSASVKIRTRTPKEFTLSLRRPYWAGDGFSVKVNGRSLKDLSPADSYVKITRMWRQGDIVDLTLPKVLRKEALPDNPSRMAFMWGPLVLAGDLGPEVRGDDGDDEKPLRPRLLRLSSAMSLWSTGSSRSLENQDGLRRPGLVLPRTSNLHRSTNFRAENTQSIGTFSLRKNGASAPPNTKRSRRSNRNFRQPRLLLPSRVKCSRSATSTSKEKTQLRFSGGAAMDAPAKAGSPSICRSRIRGRSHCG